MQFLGSMGLAPPGSGSSSSVKTAEGWWGWMTTSSLTEGSPGFWLWRQLVGLVGGPATAVRPTTPPSSSTSSSSSSSSFKPSHSRAKFEAGEVDALRELFHRHASSHDDSTLPQPQSQSQSQSQSHARLNKAAIRPALEAFAREWPGAGYDEGFREADYRYVFAQEGLDDRNRTDVDVDEFVEVRERGGGVQLFVSCVLTGSALFFGGLDLWTVEGRVDDERGQGWQEGAKTDSCRKERWRCIVVGWLPFLWFRGRARRSKYLKSVSCIRHNHLEFDLDSSFSLLVVRRGQVRYSPFGR